MRDQPHAGHARRQDGLEEGEAGRQHGGCWCFCGESIAGVEEGLTELLFCDLVLPELLLLSLQWPAVRLRVDEGEELASFEMPGSENE